MMNNVKREYKGKIVLGDKVMVSDPCYNVGTWCQGAVESVVPGTYHCYVEYCYDDLWGNRVAAIEVVNECFNVDLFDYVETDFDIGVDSGQAGIFDYEYYVKNHKDDNWYYRVCNITLARESSGAIYSNGLVSSSGYGDGSYWCYVAHDLDGNGSVIAIRVEFITDDDEDDYYED